VNVDGTGFEVLTRNSFWDLQPNWTSDGRRIVFASNRDSSSGHDLDLFIMDVNTGVVKNITNTKDLTEADPDCQAGRVVSTRFDQDRLSQSIWIMNEDGSESRRVTFPGKAGRSKTGYRFGDFDPNLSPDATRVVFVRLEDDSFKIEGKVIGNYELYVVDSDGANVKRITDTPFVEALPAWSPDGKTISFTVVDKSIGDRYRIYISDSDGDHRRKIALNSPMVFVAHECNWFPDVPGDHPDLVFAGEWYQ